MKAGAKIIFTQMDPKEDPCAVVMDLNINRRDLGVSLRVALASMLRRLALRLAALRRGEMERAERGRRERARGGAGAAGRRAVEAGRVRE